MSTAQPTKVLKFWWLALRNFLGISRDQVLVTDSLEILEKRHSHEKFLRVSIEYFSGNYWDILRTWLPILRFSLGNGIKDLVSRNFWTFLWNFSPEFPKNFLGIFLQKFLRNSQDFITNSTEFSDSIFLPGNFRGFPEKIPGNFRKIVTWVELSLIKDKEDIYNFVIDI